MLRHQTNNITSSSSSTRAAANTTTSIILTAAADTTDIIIAVTTTTIIIIIKRGAPRKLPGAPTCLPLKTATPKDNNAKTHTSKKKKSARFGVS